MKRLTIILTLLASLCLPVLAVEPDEILADPALEARARDISINLRCLVCQNQSIDDSDAELAGDLRLLVRERLTAGDSDADVIQYIVARYGEFVLLKPVLGLHTLVLWVAAPLIFVIGLAAMLLAIRRKPAVAAPKMNDAERAVLAKLSEGEDDAEHEGGIPR